MVLCAESMTTADDSPKCCVTAQRSEGKTILSWKFLEYRIIPMTILPHNQ